MKKKLFLIISCTFFTAYCFAQAGEWTWMKGDSTGSSPGIFGTQGISSLFNNPPSLYEAAEWKGGGGNFWLFGGLNFYSGIYNTLWKYNSVINEWTWMGGANLPNQQGAYGIKGIPSVNNHPGARGYGIATWVDHNGNFWLFGGFGYDGSFSFGVLNDLWKYDVQTAEWTWVSGSSTCNDSGVYGIKGVPDSSNHPGARSETNATWTDSSGNLWFFGGYRGDSLFYNVYNDLWKFDINTSEWTWMNGSNVPSQPGVYGIIGISDPDNTPGARGAYSKWKDPAGNFWLFGGGDFDSVLTRNDVWKYNPQNNEWAWMSGSNTSNPPGSVTSHCDPNVSNEPSGRIESRTVWTDCSGHFWMFGGSDCYGTLSHSDLWSFNINTLEWTLVQGSIAPNMPGFYGTQGQSSLSTYPKSRLGALPWIDDSCNLWLFGGLEGGTINILNDVWKFKPDPSCLGTFNCTFSCLPQQINFSAVETSLCEKFCTNFYDQSINNSTAWQWQFPGGNPSSSTDQNPTIICYNSPGTYDVTLITTYANGQDTLTMSNYITVYPTPPFPTVTQVGYTLTSSPASSFQWQLNSVDIPGATNQSYNVLQTGLYTVVVGDSNGCANAASKYVLITGIDEVSDAGIYIYPNPSSGSFMIELHGTENVGDVSIDVVNVIGQLIYSSEDKNLPDGSQVSSVGWKKEINLSKGLLSQGFSARGVYFIEIKTPHSSFKKKIVIVN